ncbi:uncharacterized protein [Rutidosis leptorrhynchoides]|uniref:uncharacterized protein n=1 Tax=Rutidosis leptorrhynchoides TaxID=125765 RepID=UPI003A98E864
MINSEINTIDLGTNVAGATTFQKKPVSVTKKVALRDVQNNNNNFTREFHHKSLLPFEGQSFLDASKTSGTKRRTPDHTLPLFCERSANVSQKQQNVSQINGKSMHYGSSVGPNQMGSKTSVPRFKESTSEEQRTDRFIRLQRYIKQCDGSNDRENIQLLMRLSPSELSRHAVELEKRAIQLTIEEGKEMKRIQALNVLGTSITRN